MEEDLGGQGDEPRADEALDHRPDPDHAHDAAHGAPPPRVSFERSVARALPAQVDDRMKAVEHRLRHDAQIFQEEADSGKRPILPESFLQTSAAECPITGVYW